MPRLPSAITVRTPPSLSLRQRQRAANGNGKAASVPVPQKFDVNIRLPEAIFKRLEAAGRHRAMGLGELCSQIVGAVVAKSSISVALSK